MRVCARRHCRDCLPTTSVPIGMLPVTTATQRISAHSAVARRARTQTLECTTPQVTTIAQGTEGVGYPPNLLNMMASPTSKLSGVNPAKPLSSLCVAKATNQSLEQVSAPGAGNNLSHFSKEGCLLASFSCRFHIVLGGQHICCTDQCITKRVCDV
jgi:hypothetical protein